MNRNFHDTSKAITEFDKYIKDKPRDISIYPTLANLLDDRNKGNDRKRAKKLRDQAKKIKIEQEQVRKSKEKWTPL